MEAMRSAGTGISDRMRVEAVVDTLANIYRDNESLAELAHDARNMVTALSLYCDLLEEPGVLSTVHRHYGSELRLVTEASRRLVEKLSLIALEKPANPASKLGSRIQGRLFPQGFEIAPSVHDCADFDSPNMIRNLRDELLANRNLLSAIAGPGVTLTLNPRGGALPIAMTGEDLTRLLVNLVKNASESLHSTGAIAITLLESRQETVEQMVLVVEDNGPGIVEEALALVFEPGYSTKPRDGASNGNWPARHQGLGLSIVRSIVDSAGGRIRAESRKEGGARFVMELPIHDR
ncbi:MAG TPA: sensor histidine kinase [Terracidiphilus sp.]|jgi:signal transduction histidine kinase